MRIAVNSRIYQNKLTGIPRFVMGLYQRLPTVDKANTYFFLQTNSNRRLGNTLLITLPGSLFFNFLFDFFIVNRLIRKHEIDIFHGPANILPFFKIKGVKYILTIHDLSFLRFPKNDSLMFYWYYKYAVGRSLKNADIVIADSESTKNDIMHYYKTDHKKIRVVYLGVETFAPKNKPPEPLIKGRYFFTLTTHPQRKNIYNVMRAISQGTRIGKSKFVIVGLLSDNQKQEIHKFIVKHNLGESVIVFGYASDSQLESLYYYASFFIYPSFYEGFGLPVLEAMAHKCLVLCSSTSSLKELIKDKRMVFNPYDVASIKKAINRVTKLDSSSKLEIIVTNYKVAQNFTWIKTAFGYLSAIKRLSRVK